MQFRGAAPLVIFCWLCSLLPCAAQRKSTASYRPEAGGERQPPNDLVIEKYDQAVRFGVDGASDSDLQVRVHVETAAGAQQMQELALTFDQATEQLHFKSLRVLRADGSVASTESGSVNEITTPVMMGAAPYAHYKRIRVPIPSLAPGETIEYDVARHTAKSPASDDFWFEHTFARDVIVRDERLEIDVPAGRTVRIESPEFRYETRAGKRETAYIWQRANLKIATDESSGPPAAPNAAPPDVRLTTFQNWAAVARWYAAIERPGMQASPELTAKALALTGRAADRLSKIEAIYDYVARNTHRVFAPGGFDLFETPSAARAFLEQYRGFGFHSPRPASDVFRDRFADAEDEQILLATMLRAAGIVSDAVLISPLRSPDNAAPAPSQFDHVITAVPLNARLIWMDTRPAVAPFQMLASPLRARAGLLVSASGAGRIVRTPADPPFPSSQHVQIEARINSVGTLSGKVRYAFRGDTELLLRGEFQARPREQWKGLAQSILKSDGLDSDVTGVVPGDPLATHDPFPLEIDFTEPAFLDWAAARSKTDLPLLTFGLPDAPPSSSKEKPKPIELGSPLRIEARLALALPPNLTVLAPAGVAAARDYAQFKSAYSASKGRFEAVRSLNFAMRSLPPGRAGDYAAFVRAVQADEAQPLIVDHRNKGDNAHPGTENVPAGATPAELIEAGAALLKAGNTRSAMPLLERATQLDPKQPQVWSYLGLGYLRAKQTDRAIAAFRKQVDVNPQDARAWDYLGVTLESQKQHADAEAAFRRAIALDPLDAIAYPSLGAILSGKGDYAGAVETFEKAAIVLPDNPQIRIGLAEAYLRSGAREKAAASFEKACEITRAPAVRKDVASQMASAKLTLPAACQ